MMYTRQKVLALVALIGIALSSAPQGAAADADALARGKYLFDAGGCAVRTAIPTGRRKCRC